jgi:hypothetical protein
MKTAILTSVFYFLWFSLCAQFPQAFKYQAVVRDQTGQILENKAVLFRISVLAGSGTGMLVYRESHTTVLTNAFGLATLDVGKGLADLGTFPSINWGSGEHFMKVEIYIPGSAGWQDMGTTQLLSVPYALYAKDVINNNDGDSSPTNEIQKLTLDGSVLTLDNGGGSVTLPVSGTGGDNWGTQVVKTNPTLSGQGTDASPLGVANGELQPDWTKVQNKPAGFADNMDNVDDADNNPMNEIQKISLSGTVLTLDNGGGSVTLPVSGTGGDNWGTQVVKTNPTLLGQGTDASPLGVANGELQPDWTKVQNKPAGFADNVDNVDDADNNATNEIQTLTLTGSTLGISGGNTVTLPAATGDNWGSQAVLTDATLTGNGTGTSLLKIADNGITSAKIQDNGIVTADLADHTVSTAKLGNLAVSSDKIQNGAVTTDKLMNNAVTTDKIGSGAVTGTKIAQSGAIAGQALKWNGTTWAPAVDATESSSGWSDDGTVIRLTSNTDTVQVGSVSRLGKFNVGGNIGLNLLSSIYFGSDATRITGLTGGDLRLVAEDLSMLTTEDITFGHYGDETWIKFDNANKRVGIRTLSPTDRLHVVENTATAGVAAIKGAATSTTVANYGIYGLSAGPKGRAVVGESTGSSSIGVMGLATNDNSTGVWGEGFNQGVYGKSEMATGKGIYGQVNSATGYSGYFDGGKCYVSGNTGIGTTSPAKKLHVNGSAQVKDTLYANVVNANKITTMPGLAHSIVGSTDTYHSLSTSWAQLNSVTINVPAAGYVLLFVSCTLVSDHAYNDATAVFLGISEKSDGTGVKQISHWRVGIGTGSDFITETISAQAPLQVTSAGLHTYYFMGYRKGGSDTDVVYRHECHLTALYVPVAYGVVE